MGRSITLLGDDLLRSVKKHLNINNLFKNFIRKKVPELKDCNDFEVEYRTQSLACPKCAERKTDVFFYKKHGEEVWKKVDSDLWPCNRCRDQEALKECQKESLAKSKHLITERLTKEHFHVPEQLMNSGFKNYEETNNITAGAKVKAISFTKSFLAIEKDQYNLLIMGNPGTGKTHLCAAIARTLKEKGFIVGFLTTGKLLSIIKETYQKGAMKTEAGIFRDLKKFDLLILDDLGSEAIGGNDDWRIGMIFEIVESRSGKPTVYTSNLTETDLGNAVGSRVYSRLYDNTKFIDLFTDDFRKKFQIK